MTKVPKFRAWYGIEMYDELVIHNGEFYLDWRDFEDGKTYDGAVLMQSTGLFDKNGVEIFEMDVVSLSGSLYTVAYDSENGAYKMLSHDKRWVDDYILTYTTTESLTVVGNVYENKEILG